MRALAFLMLLALNDAPATPARTAQAVLRLKDGTSYSLRTAPHMTGTRVVFTTLDGMTWSLSEADVDEVRLLSPAPAPRDAPNPQDSRDLGAYARQQRRNTGKHTLIAPAPTPKPRKAAAG